MQVSVIISFYKRIDYLYLVLAGFIKQSRKNFELIIADDGSPKSMIENLLKDQRFSNLSIKHVWHEDKGFRKNKILNASIQKAEGEYLIFIDGDCIPHPKFIEEHIENSKQKVVLTGRRVNLSEKFTNSLTFESVMKGAPENKILTLIIDGIFGKSFDVEKGFYFKMKYLRSFFNKKKRGLLGCNFSLFKSDMLDINGFDERYEAPSIGEDSDVQFRLEFNDVKVKSLNNIAVQYHLYHNQQPRPKKNLLLFEQVQKENSPFTQYGIVKQ